MTLVRWTGRKKILVIGRQYSCIVRMALSLIALAAGLVDPAASRTIRLERDGSGEYTVLQDALDAAATGDTIRVGPGRYDDFRIETFRSGGVGATLGNIQVDSLTIIGESMDTSIIGPAVRTTAYQGEYAFGILADTETPVFFRLRDIAIVNTRRPLRVAGPVNVESCRFGGGGESAVAVIMEQSARCVFKSCVFEDDGDLSSRGIGVAVGWGPSSIVIEDCDFRGVIEALNISSTDSLLVSDVRVTDGSIGCNRTMGVLRNLVVSSRRTPAVVIADSAVELHDSNLQGLYRSLVVSSGGAVIGTGNHLASPFDATEPHHATLELTGATGCTLIDGDIMPSAGGFSVFALVDVNTVPVLDLTNNYWGTTDSVQISEWILDSNDAGHPEIPSGVDLTTVEFMPVRGYSVGARKQSVGGLKGRY